MIHSSSWEDRSSTILTQSSTSDSDKSTSNFLEKRYAIIPIVIALMSSQRRATPGGDIDHPNDKGINPKELVGGR
jgi:hypothetical protein